MISRTHRGDEKRIHTTSGPHMPHKSKPTSGRSSIQSAPQQDLIDSFLNFMIRVGGIPGMINSCFSFVKGFFSKS